ncbi:putative nuclear envelope protein ndc1 [Podospora australis]|uniref:Nuclear envelope protein ndc1 n=1 Tax=Podospora australis TaxID=1536484 RepID=A0AAN6X0L9_9PEZI|nr:putative nuclear envelope protein ndc1 [Podospora australis]
MATTVAKARKLPYKDFLQPALQRRFASAGLVILLVAYIESLLLATWSSWIWTWFPLGPAGFRAFFLFLCGVLIIILRISQYHPGVRTSLSPFQTFKASLLSFNTVETLVSYVLSAYLFSLVYLWCLPEEAELQWIIYPVSEIRAKLNEKTVFFTAHCVLLGFFHAIQHLCYDTDRLIFGVVRPQSGGARAGKRAGGSGDEMARLGERLPQVIVQTVTQSLTGTTFTMISYVIFLRSFVWQMLLTMLRPLYNLPRSNMTPSTLPFSLSMITRCLWASMMISFIWAIANTAFSLFLVKSPLKNNKPLTSDSSDPNGSLLNGLKAKKLSIKCFAMWELAYIARDFPERRKGIYEDIDRADGPMWTQVYDICLKTLKEIEDRVALYGRPALPATTTTDDSLPEKRPTTEQPREDDIFQTTPKKSSGFRESVERTAQSLATSPGQPSHLKPAATQFAQTAKQKLLQAQQQATGTDNPESLFKDLGTKFIKSNLGWPFRQLYSQRLANAVLGAPFGEPSLYINAVYAISLLSTYSVTEDKYGNVQRDVAAIIRTLTTITRKLEDFTRELPPHWTDVDGTPRTCQEVDEILHALKEALSSLLDTFSPWARDLRLSLTDMRLAREAAGLGLNTTTAGAP